MASGDEKRLAAKRGRTFDLDRAVTRCRERIIAETAIGIRADEGRRCVVGGADDREVTTGVGLARGIEPASEVRDRG